jgi:hypothetical protein
VESLGGDEEPMSKEEQPQAARIAISATARAVPPEGSTRPRCWPYPMVKRFFPFVPAAYSSATVADPRHLRVTIDAASP